MSGPLHAVIETPAYLRAAQSAGMSAEEMVSAVDAVAKNPLVGDLIEGTGGCRKFRLAGRGFGKSGGYRVVTYFGGSGVPVFMLTAFSKGERANLNKAERNALAKLAAILVESLGRNVKTLRR